MQKGQEDTTTQKGQEELEQEYTTTQKVQKELEQEDTTTSINVKYDRLSTASDDEETEPSTMQMSADVCESYY